MEYQSLAETRKTLKIKWYRSQIEHSKLSELSKRSDVKGCIQAGGHFAIWLLSATLVYLFWSQQIWLGFVVALFAHGTIASFFMGKSTHELGHGTVFRSKWLNKFFLYLFSLLSWWDPFDFASSHTYHHRYTLHAKGDREVLPPIEPDLSLGLVLQLFSVNLFIPQGRIFSKGGFIPAVIATVRGAFGAVGPPNTVANEWLIALHTDQPEEHKKSIRWSRILLLFHGLVAVFSIVTGLWVFIVIITLGSFTANWLAYAVSITQHCGLKEDDADFRKCARSITLDPLTEFLYWHMNWHTEHHMFAGVPCYNLKKLHQLIADDMPKPRTLIQAWREMRDTWHRQQSDPDYYFDTPLPSTATLVRSETAPDELENSIGGLAPKGLK